MNPRQLIIKSLRFFKKRNLLLALGVAISTAVLTGALIVGDSVKFSLNRIVDQRLGNITHLMQAGDRYFTSGLADSLSDALSLPVSSVLQVEGVAVANGGQLSVNNVKIHGLDSSFDMLTEGETSYSGIKEDELVISENLARSLNSEVGDDLLIRMTRASLIPLNAPFVSDAENIVTLRATVVDIASAEELGMFNLQNSQTAPFNIFMNISWLQETMEIGEKANLLLFSGPKLDKALLDETLRSVWSVDDAGLTVRTLDELGVIEVISDRVFIDEAVSEVISGAVEAAVPILTYFVNSIERDAFSTPYSFVSTLSDEILGKNEILINRWLAADLQSKNGDSLTLSYFTVGPLRSLDVKEHTFVVKEVVEMDGAFSDRMLMPNIPGLSTAGNCRDWDTGVPVELGSIRDKDEDYWTRYKGTPKAFIANETAEELWANRFGNYTAFRVDASVMDSEQIEEAILNSLSPVSLGFEFRDVRSEGDVAAGSGVSFSQLFGGLSFFLILGAVLLTSLLFLLNLEERKGQLKTLSAMGIPHRVIQNLVLGEGMLISVIGSFIGLFLAIAYNQVIFSALNGIWADIVRTQMLEVDIRIGTLLVGWVASLLVAFLSLYFPARRMLKRLFLKSENEASISGGKVSLFSGFVCLILALVLIFFQIYKGELQNASLFFIAGGLLLVGGILLSIAYFSRLKGRAVSDFSMRSLSWRNAIRSSTRSITIIILFALGTFLVISTGSNRKDLFTGSEMKTSGTGGFLFYAESTTPVLYLLNDRDVQLDLGLSDLYKFVQVRVAEGDDASCLNLNKIVTPRVLGVKNEFLSGRFSFLTSIPELDENDPWATLSSNEFGDLVPAIADETVIKWGLELKVGDTLHYQDAKGEELKLLLVGGLAPSIFQGSVLISEENFLKHFPSSSGTNVFLIDAEPSDSAAIVDELKMGMRDFGWTMTLGAERLAEFNSITNTYLSIFLVLGALGLLLGTVGLSVVLFRSVLERKSELALLKAVGYSNAKMKSLVTREYTFLLIIGIVIGSLSALIATLPSFMSENTDMSLGMVLAIPAILLLNGIFWIWWMCGLALKNSSISQALRAE